MAYKSLLVTIEAGIASIELNRPDKRNAMNLDFWHEFPDVLRTIDAEASARVIVISGTGSMFCAGMDLEVFMNPPAKLVSGEEGRRKENLRRMVMQLQDCFTAMETIRIPVLTAIHGGCIGGGINLISAADCRYATEDAYFSVKETRLGMTADLGVLQRLPKIIPEGLARELAYTGRKLSSAEALRSGLVNSVYADKNTMMQQVMEIARQIASNSPLAVSGSKEMMNFARDHSVADGLKYMATWQSGMFQPGEMAVALQASVMKTEPEFDELWVVG
ncbi:crotonase/enoyl-CoA hydratase family protein [Endozoicomonas gorgoniicola]|uniref:Crotonase/enoyl-CoA hydratase family protein n=1 Tax=Endozoicomonas gorgoniicola TaxID=1234144 RepID=A0ABT3MRI1_9GAMM|nr:crotonase/enoyl-CoA hydratase family protein [Endozoicomonas gorgoniicola]MCW7551979.1 crotonase/enoyl-CoA hydratase family protein [Endozoicomonas gorgoniicola]